MTVNSKLNAYLLVEGENDLHVISALCGKYNVPKNFEISFPKMTGASANGVDLLLNSFRLQLRGSAGDTKALGIVLDADDIPDQRWQQVTSIIEQARLGYIIPEQPDPNGVIILPLLEYQPRLGIWLMPDNKTVGELEDFVSVLIPSQDELSVYANNALNQIEQVNLNRYGKKRSKAFIHTWLAWQDEPGLPMGRAITKKVLSPNTPLAFTFIDWLNRLFISPH